MGIEPTNKGFADLCLTTWLPRPTHESCLGWSLGKGTPLRSVVPLTRGSDSDKLTEPNAIQMLRPQRFFGAGDGTRTRDIDLGKVALYQLSYSRPCDSQSRLGLRWCQAGELSMSTPSKNVPGSRSIALSPCFHVRKRESSSRLWYCGNRVSDFQGTMAGMGNPCENLRPFAISPQGFPRFPSGPSFPQPYQFAAHVLDSRVRRQR